MRSVMTMDEVQRLLCAINQIKIKVENAMKGFEQSNSTFDSQFLSKRLNSTSKCGNLMKD